MDAFAIRKTMALIYFQAGRDFLRLGRPDILRADGRWEMAFCDLVVVVGISVFGHCRHYHKGKQVPFTKWGFFIV